MKRAFIAVALVVSFLLPSVLCASDEMPAGESAKAAPEAATPATAQPSKSLEELAKETQNPVAPLISVPFQNNINTGYGPSNEVQYLLRFQPVVPFALGRHVNLITRSILPIYSQTWPTSVTGLSDMNISFFFSPSKPASFLWGLGPILQFPTATDATLGSGKWCAGPTGVIVYMKRQWVVGVLANNVWSYAGERDRQRVSAMLVQYFINYNLPLGWYISTSPYITADWQSTNVDRWTIPFGAGVGKTFRISKQAMNATIAAYYNVKRPRVGPDATLRVAIQFLFPE